MAMTVADLLTLPHLQVSVHAGGRGVDKEIEWAHISDVPDPVPWIEPNDLLLSSGYGLPESVDEQCVLIEQLLGRGASGLALPTPVDGKLCAEALSLADRRDFPLLGIAPSVSYGAITRTIAASSDGSLRRRMLVQLQIFEKLAVAAEQGLVRGELFSQLEEVSGFRLYLSSSRGTALLREVPLPPPDLVANAGEETTARRLPGSEAFVAPVWLHGTAVGRLFAVNLDGKPSAGIAAAQHIATIVAVEYVTLQRERELLRRHGAETLARLTGDGANPAERATLLEQCGFDSDSPVVVFATRASSGEFDDNGVSEDLFGTGIPHLLLRDDLGWLGLLPHLPTTLETLESFGGECHLGLSEPCTASHGLTTPVWQARWAAERAVDRDAPIVRFGTDHGIPTWLPPESARLQEIVADVLGKLIEHDASNKSDLIHSLRTYLHNDRQLKLTAKELHIHPHTLAYRLRRTEEVTQRKVASVKDASDLWLALRALDTLERQGN